MRSINKESTFLTFLFGAICIALWGWWLHVPTYGDWLQSDVDTLQSTTCPGRPTVVVVESVPGAFGSANVENDRFIIRISPGYSRAVARDTLIHEWAHALTWKSHGKVQDHDDEWGKAYARVYRALIECQ